jgi:DNA-binding MarR family transcriptional regulator
LKKESRRNDRTLPGVRSKAAQLLTELILEVFHVNGRLVALGNRRLAPFGLSSAKWQVMGAIAATPLTSAQIGRRMGLTRQGVLWVANQMVRDGLAEFIPNPDHRNAQLLSLTRHGLGVLEQITRGQAEWANQLAAGLDLRKLSAALETIRGLSAAADRQQRGGVVGR